MRCFEIKEQAHQIVGCSRLAFLKSVYSFALGTVNGQYPGRSLVLFAVFRQHMLMYGGVVLHDLALKECAETEYWIEMLVGAKAMDANQADKLMLECGIIRRMLVKSLNTAKNPPR